MPGCNAYTILNEFSIIYMFLLDCVIGLSCQFEMYVNIMLTNNKMVQDIYVNITIGVVSTRGEEERGLWENETDVSKCQP